MRPVVCWRGSPPRLLPATAGPAPPRLELIVVYMGFVSVSSMSKFLGQDGFIILNPGFLQFSSPTLGMSGGPPGEPLLESSSFQIFLPEFHISLPYPRSGCLYVTHVYPSRPAALIILFPTLLFGIFHRHKIYCNSRGENSKSLAKFRSRAHLNFYSGFSIYLIYSCLWLRCHIVGVLWPAQACSGRLCVRPHFSLAGAAQTAALIYLVLEDAVCSIDSVI